MDAEEESGGFMRKAELSCEGRLSRPTQPPSINDACFTHAGVSSCQCCILPKLHHASRNGHVRCECHFRSIL